MIYEAWYQGSWWLFALFAVLCAAILWRWASTLRWPWQLLIVGTPLIAFAFPLTVEAEVDYLAPAFIQFGFELVDSGFDIASAWPLYQLPALVLLLWVLLCIGLAFFTRNQATSEQDDPR
ncbi:hypothetical protein [Salinibius halmophilus]|uniref:hypothetical protein n=1 Tax=Salinibius halmophilus TaxID=1853216 RepID=UPI000E6745F6|nr:hypothetical protein [Salinibius halmophilus]